jgi:NitT/TauT family transport system permease protein
MNLDVNSREQVSTKEQKVESPAPSSRGPVVRSKPLRQKTSFRARLTGLGWPLLVLAGLLTIWQGIVLLEIVNPIIFPSPLTVIGQVLFVGANLFSGGYMLEEYLTTMQEVAVGFFLAAVVGFTIGTIVGVTEVGRKGVMPLVVSIQTMPKVAFAPVFIAWFGFGMTPKVLLAMIVALFPVIVNTASGLMSASAHELKLFRQMGASKWQLLWKLQLPAALPSIFAGLRTASVFAVIGAIIAEFIGGGSGFGELIRVGADMLRIDRVFGLIVWLSFLGLSLYSIVAFIERRVVFWRGSQIQQPTA